MVAVQIWLRPQLSTCKFWSRFLPSYEPCEIADQYGNSPSPEGGFVRIDNPLFQFRMPTNQPMRSEGVGTENTWQNDAEQEDYKNVGIAAYIF